jgi:hypothetical protein
MRTGGRDGRAARVGLEVDGVGLGLGRVIV